MKRFIIIILLSFIYSQYLNAQDYYWSAGVKHYLNDTQNRFIVVPKISTTDSMIMELVNSITNLNHTKVVSSIQNINTLKSSNLFKQVIPTKEFGNMELLFTGEILLKPKNNITISQIISLVGNEISIKDSTIYSTYTMNVMNWDSLFFYANKIYESGLVADIHPEL